MSLPTSREGRQSLAATSLAHFINDGLLAMIPLMYPVLATYGISLVTIAVLVALQNVFSILASPVVGVRSDEGGNYTNLIVFGLGLVAVGTIGYAVSVQFSAGSSLTLVLVVFTILMGVGSAFYHPLGATVLRAKWRAETLGNAMGINGSVGSVGRVVLPISATFMLGILALPYLGILGVVCLALSMAVLPLMNGVKFSRKQGLGATRRSFLPKRELARRLLPLTIVSFSRGLFTGVFPLLPLFLLQVDGFDKFTTGILFSLSLGVGILSQLIFGYLQTRYGSGRSLAISNLGGVIVLFVFTLSSAPSVVVASLVIFGLFSYSAFPLLLGAVQDLTDLEEMTSGSAIVWGIGNSSGSAAAPLLVGALAIFYSGSPVPGFIASAALGIPSVVLMPFIGRRRSL